MPASLRITVDNLEEVKASLRKLLRAQGDLRPVFNDIGEHLVRTTKDRFRDQVDPDGQPWEPLSEDYRQSKRRNRDKILTLDGYLGGTINYNGFPASAGIVPA